MGDLGVGECAGEIVPFVEFGLQESEQELYEAQTSSTRAESAAAAVKAFASMVTASKALVRHVGGQVRDDADDVVPAFREKLHDTGALPQQVRERKVRELLVEAPRKQSVRRRRS